MFEKGGWIYAQPSSDISHVANYIAKILSSCFFCRKRSLTGLLSKCPIFVEQPLKRCFTLLQVIGHLQMIKEFSDVTLGLMVDVNGGSMSWSGMERRG